MFIVSNVTKQLKNEGLPCEVHILSLLLIMLENSKVTVGSRAKSYLLKYNLNHIVAVFGTGTNYPNSKGVIKTKITK